ncbi:MAG: Fe-S cluster assembly sulfur transfer protein SufU [Acidobacteriota bacterium]
MSDLRELYQQVILDHHKRPKNFRRIDEANHTAQGFNPLCGDKISLYLVLDGDVVRDVAFEGSGCAISTASASMMTEALKGKRVEEIEAIFEAFHEMVMGSREPNPDSLGKLAVFTGVREFPLRVKCATLAWHTMMAALQGKTETVVTE